MHDTKVVMKNGREHESPIHEFRPKAGWMTLFEPEDRLYFRDMVSAVTKGERISIGRIGEQDELERAREAGWDGVS